MIHTAVLCALSYLAGVLSMAVVLIFHADRGN